MDTFLTVHPDIRTHVVDIVNYNLTQFQAWANFVKISRVTLGSSGKRPTSR